MNIKVKLQYKYTYTCVKQFPDVSLPRIFLDTLCFYRDSIVLLAQVIYNARHLGWWGVAFILKILRQSYKDYEHNVSQMHFTLLYSITHHSLRSVLFIPL